MTNAESDTRVGMLAYIKHDLGQVGIRVKIQPVPFNELISAIRDNRRFDAIILGWGAAVPPDPAFSRNVLLSSGLSHICIQVNRSRLQTGRQKLTV